MQQVSHSERLVVPPQYHASGHTIKCNQWPLLKDDENCIVMCKWLLRTIQKQFKHNNNTTTQERMKLMYVYAFSIEKMILNSLW